MGRKHKAEQEKPVNPAKEDSGCQKRKKAKLIEDELAVLRKQAAVHFRPSNSSSSSNVGNAAQGSPNQNISVEKIGSELRSAEEDLIYGTEEQVCEDNGAELTSPAKTVSPLEIHFDRRDPGTWPNVLTELQRRDILTAPVKNINCVFPTINGHAFSAKYFVGKKPNGETFNREWLLYSQTTNSAHCLPCCIFSSHSGTSTWAKYGANKIVFQDFFHLYQRVPEHEATFRHLENVRAWKVYNKQLSTPSSLHSISSAAHQININHWCDILKGILDAVLFLAKNNLAFQGSSSDISSRGCGNFLNLVKLLAKYYPPLTTHLENLKKGTVSYLSPQSQNEFIGICGNYVRSQLINKVKHNKYFAIMFDSTPDTSHTDQISQVIRSVTCTRQGCKIEEYFVDFVASPAKTGLDIFNLVTEKLQKDGLDIENCRGQGYDNGANMSGIYKGLQRRIHDINPLAKFIPCAAHSLNLVGTNAAEHVKEAKLILGKVQNTYTFFSQSTSRRNVLKGKLKTTLKGQSTTRWAARADAVSSLYNQYQDVLEVLTEIKDSTDFASDVTAAADSRRADMFNFKFLLGLTVWETLLSQINICNLSLQDKQSDVNHAEKKLKAPNQVLQKFSEDGFELSLDKAISKADSIQLKTTKGFEDVRRNWGINRRYLNTDDQEEQERSRNKSNFERFKSEFFDKLLVELRKEMDSRFAALKQCSDDFGFLRGSLLQNLDHAEQEKYVKDLCLKYHNDLNANKFVNEVYALKPTIAAFEETEDISNLGPLDVLNVLYKNDLDESFCNCTTALRIFLTLPVSVASNERAFSKLKIIKNYMRSSMGQERLSNLAVLSIEYEMTEGIDFQDIIRDFASKKCRKVDLG